MNLISAKVPNQLVNKNNFPGSITSGGVTITDNGDGSITLNGERTNAVNYNILLTTIIPNNHIFVALGNFDNNRRGYLYGTGVPIYDVDHDDIYTNTSGGDINKLLIYSNIYTSPSTFINVKMTPQLIDLTELYGAGNEPTTVAQFKADYPLDYYPYNPTSYTGILTQNNAAITCDISQMLPSNIGVVDLGTLTWFVYEGSSSIFYGEVQSKIRASNAQLLCSEYTSTISSTVANLPNLYMRDAGTAYVYIRNDSYTDAASFKQAMQGVLLFYKKATT